MKLQNRKLSHTLSVCKAPSLRPKRQKEIKSSNNLADNYRDASFFIFIFYFLSKFSLIILFGPKAKPQYYVAKKVGLCYLQYLYLHVIIMNL